MKMLKVFFRRVCGMSIKRMLLHVNKINRETNVPKVKIFFDMIWCGIRYGIGYLDYHVFGFADKKSAQRKTYMTMNHNLALAKKLNDSRYYNVFNNKDIFNEKFNSFLGRKWLDLRKCDSSAFADFCRGKKSVFAKVTSSFGGQGVSRIELTESTDFEVLYRELINKEQWLIEDTIIQHEDMNLLFPNSINTVRIVTVLTKKGPEFVYSLVRMGSGKSCVDNISSGGLYTGVSDDGIITRPAFCDKTGDYYDKHPVTGTAFNGFKIPYFKEAVELCKEAAKVQPEVGYVGWDIAITPDGPVIVEGNNLPGYDMCQNSRHRDSGILPVFEKILGEKIKI